MNTRTVKMQLTASQPKILSCGNTRLGLAVCPSWGHSNLVLSTLRMIPMTKRHAEQKQQSACASSLATQVLPCEFLSHKLFQKQRKMLLWDSPLPEFTIESSRRSPTEDDDRTSERTSNNPNKLDCTPVKTKKG